jgi:hypothetical protein
LRLRSVVVSWFVLWFAQVEGREAIARKFEFGDFKQAWEFMGKTAVLAEEVGNIECCRSAGIASACMLAPVPRL